MRITIDQSILDKHGLSMGEFLVLYLNKLGADIKVCSDSLVSKGLAGRDLFSEGSLVLSDNTKELVSSILIDSDSRVVSKDEEYTELANTLRELYPAGRKEGTTYAWRGTVQEIAKKLKTLVVKYGYTYTKEQAIEATKTYVESFNGNYTKMRLLKYFLLKAEKDADGNVDVISDFMNLIENETDVVTDNWQDSVR